MSALQGFDQVMRELDDLEDEGIRIARAAVSAGVSVLTRAAKSAAQGTIKEEIGGSVRVVDGHVIGKAGLMVYPDGGREIRGLKPHGFFLDHGTKYIAARHNISNALSDAATKAAAAVRRTAFRKVSQLKRK